MPRFFVGPVAGDRAVVEGEDARHIARVLRMREGEELTLCDGAGWDYRCRIAAVSTEGVEVKVLEREASRGEPPVALRLYQALPKGDKLDFIVQKATELGACQIVPVLTARCVSRPGGKEMEKKRVRLQRIAYEAAKQSGRGIVPEVSPLLSLKQAVEDMKRGELAILFYEGSTVPLRTVLEASPAPGSVSILVGSEGGFAPEEAELAQAAGLRDASLGSRILRCETAPVAALSAILYALGAM